MGSSFLLLRAVGRSHAGAVHGDDYPFSHESRACVVISGSNGRRPPPFYTFTFSMLSLDIEQSEESSWVDEDRIHHIDNLRATLTIILIVQHTLIENASATPGFQSLPLSAFVFQCKTTIPGLFFFISVYAARISWDKAWLQSGTGQRDA